MRTKTEKIHARTSSLDSDVVAIQYAITIGPTKPRMMIQGPASSTHMATPYGNSTNSTNSTFLHMGCGVVGVVGVVPLGGGFPRTYWDHVT